MQNTSVNITELKIIISVKVIWFTGEICLSHVFELELIEYKLFMLFIILKSFVYIKRNWQSMLIILLKNSRVEIQNRTASLMNYLLKAN